MSINPNQILSFKVRSMEESATIRMAQKTRDLSSKGIHVVNLTLGEPDFDTPEFIKEAAYEAMKSGDTKYTPVPGTLDLRKAICEKFKAENNLEYQPNQIVVSNGAKQSIANVCLSLLDEGDEAIVLAPYWVSYYEIIKFAGGSPIVLYADIDQDFKVSAVQIEQAITPKTKMIIYSSPCNPSGSVYTHEELEAIAAILRKHPQIIVVADEIYEYINFTQGHCSIASLPGMLDRTATINGFSKGFAMTGWRLGYMGGPVWLAEACNKIQGQVTSGAASFSQAAAAVALRSSRKEAMMMKEAFLKRRDLIHALLGDIPGFKVNVPQGAFYMFPDISAYFGTSNGSITINDADDMAEILLTEGHVGTVSGVAFGSNKCIRLSYAASEDNIREACKRIKSCLANFK